MSPPELVKTAPGLLTEHVSAASLLSMQPITQVKIDTGGAGGFDYKKEIEKMASSARGGGATLQIDLTASLPRLASELDVGGLLLAKARDHVRQKEFREALTKLDTLLGQEPDHPEARFLRAVCLCNLGESAQGFESLIRAHEALPEAGARLEPQLSERIDALRDTIRTHVFMRFPQCMVTMDHRLVAAQIDRLLELDASAGVLYALRAILLLERGETVAAYETVEAGVRAAAHDVPPLLASLRAGLAGEVLHQCLAPAIAEYKKGEYQRAWKVMRDVDPRFVHTREYQLLAAHLKQAGGGGLLRFFTSKKSPTQQSFAGPTEDRWLLQELIVRQEIGLTRRLLDQDEEEQAELVAHQALAFAPGLPLACYFAAGCGFRRLNAGVARGEAIDLDQVLLDLARCQRLAAVATEDHRIVSAAGLKREIEGALAFFTRLQMHIEQQRAEARLVNGIIQEFVSIMEGAKEGIDSVETLRSVHDRMRGLRQRIRDAKGRIEAEQGRKALAEVESAVEKNLEALDEIAATVEAQRREMAVVEEAAKRFRGIMGKVKDGVGSEQELTDLESDLRRLKQDLPDFQGRVSGDAPKKHLDELAEAIEHQLGQIAGVKVTMRDQLRDRGVVDDEGRTFQSIASRLTSGSAFSSRSDLQGFRDAVDNARDSARNARTRVSARGALAALDQMIEQYDVILAKIDSIL